MNDENTEKVHMPLKGVKVVELQGVIAGAYCAAILADFGADVIKVEPPKGDLYRPIQGSFVGVNRGKRFIVIDLGTEEGREVLHKLVETCDVLIHTFRPGSEKRMGVDYETVKRINPQIIYYSVSGYGIRGNDKEKPAYDFILQARSGMARIQGAESGPPVLLRVAAVDHMTALLGAYGILLALLVRARTGKGQFVNSSLLAGSIASQSGSFITYSSKTDDKSRIGTWGIKATYRIYQTKDGYIFLGCTDEDMQWWALCQVLDKVDLAKDQRFGSQEKRKEHMNELADILGKTFLERKSTEWLRLLEEANIPAAPVNKPEDVFSQPQVIHENLVTELETHDLGQVKVVGVPIKLSKTPGRVRTSTLALGEDTTDIMLELGYPEMRINELRRKGVVV